MDELITRVLQGSASPFETQRLKHWREESPENERYFQEVSKVWELTAPEPQAVSLEPPPLEVFTGQSQARSRTQGPWGGVPWGRWGLLAACLGALAVGSYVFAPGGPAVQAEYHAPNGLPRTIALADGSFVRLAPESSLEELDDEDGRRVRLQGRAFFAVARDEARPFVVETGSGSVRVLGTRFEVRERAGRDMRTVVVEGRVEVMASGVGVEIGAGQVAEIQGGGEPAVTTPPDVYSLLDWNQGLLVFQGTPLHEVAEEVSRQFGRPVELVDTLLRNRRVTAWFGDESFEEVTESLCLVTGAHCSPLDDGIRMERSREPEVEG